MLDELAEAEANSGAAAAPIVEADEDEEEIEEVCCCINRLALCTVFANRNVACRWCPRECSDLVRKSAPSRLRQSRRLRQKRQ